MHKKNMTTGFSARTAAVISLLLLFSGCSKGCSSISAPAPPPSPVAAPSKIQYIHAGNGAALYEAPDLLSRTMATIPDRSEIRSGERSGQWVWVSWQGKTGWTCANKLSDSRSGITVTTELIAGTWCGENEEPGTGCYSFRDDGKMGIECPMCFNGTWYIRDDQVFIQLVSPEQSPAGEPLDKITFAGDMTVMDLNRMKASFPQGDGSGHNEGGSWIVTRYKEVRSAPLEQRVEKQDGKACE